MHKEEIFYYECARHLNGLPGETVDVPLLDVFKARLDGALSNVV